MKLFPEDPLGDILGLEDVLKPASPSRGEAPSEEPLLDSEETEKSPEERSRALGFIKAEAEGCQKCRLWETRTTVVFGEGDPSAELMFVGEGPGAEEDRTGRPFVGKSGQLLTKMIAAMGFKREEVYIANIVKCRPPENRNPFGDEAATCIGYLKRQISVVDPEFIVCLGSVAVNCLLQTSVPITRLRGTWQSFCGYKVMPTYHPSYLLRSPNKKIEAWRDLKTVMKAMGKDVVL